MKLIAIILVVLFTGLPAFAQQQSATIDQRIGAQIGALVLQNAGLTVQNEQLQQQLATAQAKIKELEAKVPKEDHPAAR